MWLHSILVELRNTGQLCFVWTLNNRLQRLFCILQFRSQLLIGCENFKHVLYCLPKVLDVDSLKTVCLWNVIFLFLDSEAFSGNYLIYFVGFTLSELARLVISCCSTATGMDIVIWCLYHPMPWSLVKTELYLVSDTCVITSLLSLMILAF